MTTGLIRTLRRLALALSAAVFLPGCAAAFLEAEKGVEHPVYTPWAKAEAARLAPIYGTPADIETRFLDRGPLDNGWWGWTNSLTDRITLVLRNKDGTPLPARDIRNHWHHEWLHVKRGDFWLTDGHDGEFEQELRKLGLWEP